MRNRFDWAHILATFVSQLATLAFIVGIVAPALYLTIPNWFPKIFLDVPIPHVADLFPQPKFQAESFRVNPVTGKRDKQLFTLQELRDAAKRYNIWTGPPREFIPDFIRSLSGGSATPPASAPAGSVPIAKSLIPFLVSTSFGLFGGIALFVESGYTLLWLFGLLVWRTFGGEAGRERFARLQIGRLSVFKRFTGVGVWVATPLYWLYVAKFFQSIDPGYEYSITNLWEMLLVGLLWLGLSLLVLAYAKWRYKRSYGNA